MNKQFQHILGITVSAAMLVSLIGCTSGPRIEPAPPKPLGAEVDQINQMQEENAEASKFVIYQHEFELNTEKSAGWRLNYAGEDHVKQIAANISTGVDLPIVIERSTTSVKPGTEYEYPIHLNDELDLKRRRVVVAVLLALGVSDAEERVLVAPAFAEGLNAAAAAAAYSNGYSRNNGGGLGGGFGGGGFGGF